MVEQFIITIINHRILGYIFAPFWTKKQAQKDYLKIDQRITISNLESFVPLLTEEQIEIVNIIEEYNDNILLKVFLKKKQISTQDFLSTLDSELFANHIRPYIEKRLSRCTHILEECDIPIYLKTTQTNIYESDKITFNKESAETIFNFIKDSQEFKYFLSIRHQEKEMKLNSLGKIIIDTPCLLLLNNNLFFFSDINGKKLLPFFNKPYVLIPKNFEKKYLSTFVKNTIEKYDVRAQGFEIINQKTKAKAILSLEKSLDYSPIIVLKFRYNEKNEFYANKPPFVTVELQEKDNKYTFVRLSRDLSWETFKISELISLGLVNTNDSIFELPIIKYDENSETKIEDFVEWIKNTINKLRKIGFEVKQDYFEIKYNLNPVNLKIKISEKKDWFDIKAIVIIGDFKIPFIRFKNNILQKNRIFILPNGEIAILPIEWFSQYNDMFSFGSEVDDIIQLKNHHVSIAKNLLEGINKQHITELSTTKDAPSYEIPKGINANLRPYQKEGFSWLHSFSNNTMGVCLADDMGLGKTLQTITLLKSVIDNNSKKLQQINEVNQGVQLSIFDKVVNTGDTLSIKTYVNTSLIVMPASLIFNWTNEINNFAPDLKVHKYIGTRRSENISDFDQYDVVLTTYGLVRNEIEKLKKYRFLYIVLDESQYVKNPQSKIYKAVIQLNSEHRVTLTGTPIENSLTDLWAQFNFLNKGLLGNLNFFKKEFVYPIEKYNKDENKIKERKLKSIISPFLLRRTKNEVAKELPPISENIIYCDMTEEQQIIYEEEKSKIRNYILENIEKTGKEKAGFLILQGLTKLRQLANHPKLINEEYNFSSGKFDEIIRNIENIIVENHKVLIFSSFVKNLELFKKYFEANNISYSWLSGETKKREDIIKEFQEDAKIKIFLISLKAGGVGLNLTAADYVFITDPWWNPAVEDQAINRAHRIGQSKNVFVYRFISNNTLEEKINKFQLKKAQLAENFMTDQNVVNNFSVDELLELVN